MSSPRFHKRSFRLVGLFAAVLAGSVLSSCTQARLAVSTGAGSCFSVLPLAQKAGPLHKAYLGVRAVDKKTAQQMLGQTISSNESFYCVVAFRVQPQSNQHGSASHHLSGIFSLVVATPSSRAVVGVKQVSRLPFSFRRNVSVN